MTSDSGVNTSSTNMSAKDFPAISRMSAPAAKAFSDPVSTTARTFGSASKAESACPTSARSWAFSAFSASGRFNRTSATCSSISTMMV